MHEACLIKWLRQRNIRHCELCKTNFEIREEYGSPYEVTKKVIFYLTSSKRRILKLVVYAIYIYLFSQRFSSVFKFFKEIIQHLIRQPFKSGVTLRNVDAIMLHSKLGKPGNGANYRFKSMFLSLVRLCYNSFVLVQLGCIGYAESYRVRHMIGIMLSNVR